MFRPSGITWEIIVVDDASPDGDAGDRKAARWDIRGRQSGELRRLVSTLS